VRVPVGVQQAAYEFKDRLMDGTRLFEDGKTAREILAAVLGAFLLYHLSWSTGGMPRRFKIKHWKWPYDCLDNMSFPGDEPWAVLLRHALELRMRLAGLLPEDKG
jgi:hypothetical protein